MDPADYAKVVQIQLKTPGDLKNHLETNGRSRYVIRDTATGWWWFCDHRNRLLEFVFNSGKPVAFVRVPESDEVPEGGWEATLESGHGSLNVELMCPFQNPAMHIDELNDTFWNDFVSQDLGTFAYWDIDNAENDLDEFIFYWEMEETGAHLEPLPPPPGE